MKITAVGIQVRDKSRVNVSIDGRYRFSLDILQVTELGVKVGRELTEAELTHLEQESQFGKVYTRALEYCLVRPRSVSEVKQYLYRKTRPSRGKEGQLRPGVSPEVTARVLERLIQKGHVDDERFTRYWLENRRLRAGASRRLLQSEIAAKGVSRETIERLLEEHERPEEDELQKVIQRKARRYSDPQKLMAYLARQGFAYDDIKQALETYSAEDSG